MYLESCDYSSEYEYWLRMCAVNRLKFLYCIKNYAFLDNITYNYGWVKNN